ncbi:MAG: ribosome biogenesis GTPase YlqF [Filifactoraceae bacterium]
MESFDGRVHINWYPGHMKKTKELLIASINLVDIILEVVDSRVPYSSKNPDINEIAKNKARILLLNKDDLAEVKITEKWVKYYESLGYVVLSISLLDPRAAQKIYYAIERVFEIKAKQIEEKGMKKRAIRLMIAGVPNSGKSTVINRLSGKKSTQTGDRPGVTKGKQWVRLKGNLEMLDTPGILWPKFEDDHVAKMLAFTGTIKDEVLEIEDIAYDLLEILKSKRIDLINKRYDYNFTGDEPTIEIMDKIAIKRGFITKGKEIDYERLSKTLLNEFRSGAIGRFSLEDPGDNI